MNLKEYIKKRIQPYYKVVPDLELIYDELINLGFHHTEVYVAINEVIRENIEQIIKDHKEKNDL